MTENEAIELLKNNYPKTRKMVDGRLQGGFDDHECDVGIVIDLAIKALEEIQQYRAIGTVEECRAAVEQLENERKFWKHAYDKDLGKEKARSYAHASEIVKGGGVDAKTDS